MASGHVLVVEDEEETRRLYSKWLQRAEVPHEVCDSAEMARDRLRANGVALALVDVGLPGEDGLDLAKWIRARHPDVNVILVTGDIEAVDRELQFDAIAKPVQARAYCEAVRRLLREANHWQSIRKLKRGATASKRLMKVATAIVAAIQAALAAWLGVTR